EVAAGLLEYLSRHWGRPDLRFLMRPSPIADGWETYTFRFQLHSINPLPSVFARPLILRVFASPQGVPRLRHEFAAQQYMHQIGYPVAEPLLLEESCDLFGGPFQIMDQVPGQTLVEELLHRPW